MTSVLDLGCGPAEITCELARRLPDVRFTGIDQSEQAIRAARENAARLALTNITFEVADVESYVPPSPVDVICMFDAFHHLLAPKAFVDRMRAHARAFLLIEPAGKWTGQWDRRFDLDWIAEAVAGIRMRMEHHFGLAPQAAAPSPPAPALQGDPTEHRYTETDLAGFFDGLPLQIHGTIAGLERYGVDPHAASALRAKFGEVTYQLVRHLEETLTTEGIDLWAKHWVVFASPANACARVRPARVAPPAAAPPPSGPWMAHAARYRALAYSPHVGAGQTFDVECEVSNDGWLEWRSDGAHPVRLSYHWLDAKGARVAGEGTRTPLPRAVAQGESLRVNARIDAPPTSGAYTLALDLVEEGKTWFSEQGVPPARLRVDVGPKRS